MVILHHGAGPFLRSDNFLHEPFIGGADRGCIVLGLRSSSTEATRVSGLLEFVRVLRFRPAGVEIAQINCPQYQFFKHRCSVFDLLALEAVDRCVVIK
jgi:hypothetical protein